MQIFVLADSLSDTNACSLAFSSIECDSPVVGALDAYIVIKGA